MPTYDYQCSACGNIQEEFHSMNKKQKIKCNKCNSNCHRIFSGGSFILKGDGFESYNSRIKKSMLEKNKKMKNKMRERSSEAIKNIGDLKK